MSFAQINGINLAYDVQGSGPPLLLVTGLGGYMAGWRAQIPALAARHQVIFFDNRGAGESDQPPGPYTMTQLAADAVGLLDYLGIESAHIFGVSMGGMIAQHIALDWPERVRGLILGCTMCCFAEYVFADPSVMEWLMPGQPRTREEIVRSGISICFSSGFLQSYPDIVDEYVQIALQMQQREDAYLGQLTAIMGHTACARLEALTAPTLVIHGTDDILIPVANGRLLAQRVPGARLLEIEGAGHLFFIEQPELTNQAVLDFLAEIDRSSADLQLQTGNA
ncbi:MAG: alpha/beta hydrolase [Herpetosiphonaceae bacterium]|nr:MAG: alpha/beta hydrolase [Herpetosiphonaceae bacterium]